MTPAEAIIVGVYLLVLSVLAVYGWHRFHLVYVYTKHRDRVPAARPAPQRLPRVTVQLPVFNEVYVVERLIEAASRLDYPRHLLQIQVLDDSTDETSDVAALAVRRQAERGVAITHVRRATRAGYKAGALANGLRTATGELIAIFDADFVPEPGFLRAVVGQFEDPAVGLVQARWGHINAEYSALTRVQAILLDAHFVLEHGGRNRAGYFFNFNGTAGVWRRAAIEEAGGWQHDTLTEDLDLSYRAQLAGWRFVFLPDVVVPAEIPVEMNAFKSQQHRWTKGSVQTCLKLLPRILGSDAPAAVKREAFFHLTANVNYVLMVLLSLLLFPSMVVRAGSASPGLLLLDIPLFVAATLSFVNFYAVSQREIYPSWWSRALWIPVTLCAGIGLCVNNAGAVVEAVLGRRSGFARTAKYGVERPGDEWSGRRYQQVVPVQPLLELGLGVYFTAAVVYAIASGILVTLPFLMLFQAGFLFTGGLSLVQQLAGAGLPLTSQVAEE